MDEFDIAVLDMSGFEFQIECHVADQHKGEGVPMHRGPSNATHIIYATCGTCGAKTEETNVCLDFIEQAYSDEKILKWKCPLCKNYSRYPSSLTIVGCI